MFKLIAGMTAPFIGFVLAKAGLDGIHSSIITVPDTGAMAGSIEHFYGSVLTVLLAGGIIGAGITLLVWSWREITRG